MDKIIYLVTRNNAIVEEFDNEDHAIKFIDDNNTDGAIWDYKLARAYIGGGHNV